MLFQNKKLLNHFANLTKKQLLEYAGHYRESKNTTLLHNNTMETYDMLQPIILTQNKHTSTITFTPFLHQKYNEWMNRKCFKKPRHSSWDWNAITYTAVGFPDQTCKSPNLQRQQQHTLSNYVEPKSISHGILYSLVLNGSGSGAQHRTYPQHSTGE